MLTGNKWSCRSNVHIVMKMIEMTDESSLYALLQELDE